MRHQTSTPLSQQPRSPSYGDLEPDNLVGGEKGLWIAGWSSAAVENRSGSASSTADSEALSSLQNQIDEERSNLVHQVPTKVNSLLRTSLVQDPANRHDTVSQMTVVPGQPFAEIFLSSDQPETSQVDRFDEFWSRNEDSDPDVQRLRRRSAFLLMMFVALLPLTAFLAWQAGTGSRYEEESFAQEDDSAEDYDGASSVAGSSMSADDSSVSAGEESPVEGLVSVAEENSAGAAPGGEETSLFDRASGDAAGHHSFEEGVSTGADVADRNLQGDSEFGTGHWADTLDLAGPGTADSEGTYAEDPPPGPPISPDPKMKSESYPQPLPYPQPEPEPTPVFTPDPEPTPVPEPAPQPEPAPVLAPDPEPNPAPEPAPHSEPVVGPATDDFPNPIGCTSSSRLVFWFIKTDGSQFGDGRNVYGCPNVVLAQPAAAEIAGGRFHLKFERCWADRIEVDFDADGLIDWTVRGSAGVCFDASTPDFAGGADGSAVVTIKATGSAGQQAAYWVAGHRS